MAGSKAKKNPILMWLASLKITVSCLLLFMVITVLGTLYQVDHGIGEARDVYFSSWVIMFKGMFPFPGGQLIVWVFAINLLSACYTRFTLKWSKSGIWLAHTGLLMLCFSSFYTHILAVEANLQIAEGDRSGYAMIDGEWELTVWYEEDGYKVITAYPMNDSKLNSSYIHPGTELSLSIHNYIKNSDVVQDFNVQGKYHNVSGITDIVEKNTAAMGRDVPGMILNVKGDDGRTIQILLYGAEMYHTQIQMPDKLVNFQLRPKRLKLPITIELVDVEQQVHEGTTIAKSYESTIKIIADNTEREARIFMNHPLTVDYFTFYQSSYARGMDGREVSTFSVVKNSGKYLPYIACLIVGLGMILQLMLMPFYKSIVKPAKRKE